MHTQAYNKFIFTKTLPSTKHTSSTAIIHINLCFSNTNLLPREQQQISLHINQSPIRERGRMFLNKKIVSRTKIFSIIESLSILNNFNFLCSK